MTGAPELRRLRAARQATSVFDVPLEPGERFRLHEGDTTEYVLDRSHGGKTVCRAQPRVRGKRHVKAAKRHRQALRAQVHA